VSGTTGQIREQLGRIEAKLDGLADDVRWIARHKDVGVESDKVDELLAVVAGLRHQIEEIHEPVQLFTTYRRRMIALGAGALSLGGFMWAFAQPVWVMIVQHIRFQP
jgi:hypothetical protein